MLDMLNDKYKASDFALKQFLDTLREEISFSNKLLAPEEYAVFSEYTKSFCLNSVSPAKKKIHYRVFLRGYLRYITSLILEEKKTFRILDAGSGYGTESILFTFLGAKVIGIDLRANRLEIAKKRFDFYQKKLNMKGNVKFSKQNIFSLDNSEKFDVIWVKEAISHIHPAGEFLKFCYKLIKNNGVIIIVDSNGLYLPNQIKLLKMRGLNWRTTFYDPDTGEQHPYAADRIFTVFNMNRLLRKAGFNVVYQECFWRFMGRTNNYIYNNVISQLNKFIPFSMFLGGKYIISAKKEV